MSRRDKIMLCIIGFFCFLVAGYFILGLLTGDPDSVSGSSSSSSNG